MFAERKKRRTKRPTVAPSDILRQATPSVRAIVAQLRKAIREAAPELSEIGYPGWRCIAYRHAEVGYLCGIFPLEATVQLYFEHGAALADPIGILQGTGRQTRHLEFATAADVAEKAVVISMLVREAAGLARGRHKKCR
jgi:hypothetical protein